MAWPGTCWLFFMFKFKKLMELWKFKSFHHGGDIFDNGGIWSSFWKARGGPKNLTITWGESYISATTMCQVAGSQSLFLFFYCSFSPMMACAIMPFTRRIVGATAPLDFVVSPHPEGVLW
jgi:hypothetical protein